MAIPYKMKQGINSRRTGNLLSRAGNLLRLTGNCPPAGLEEPGAAPPCEASAPPRQSAPARPARPTFRKLLVLVPGHSFPAIRSPAKNQIPPVCENRRRARLTPVLIFIVSFIRSTRGPSAPPRDALTHWILPSRCALAHRELPSTLHGSMPVPVHGGFAAYVWSGFHSSIIRGKVRNKPHRTSSEFHG